MEMCVFSMDPIYKAIQIINFSLKVGSFSFECIIILLIYFTNCQKALLQVNEKVLAKSTELKVLD